MPIQLNKLFQHSPYLYHLTYRPNLKWIKNTRCLKSAASLLKDGNLELFLKQKRPEIHENSKKDKNRQLCATKKYTSRPYHTNVKRRHWSITSLLARNNFIITILLNSLVLLFSPLRTRENCW